MIKRTRRIEDVPVAKMTVDPEVQRSVDRARVAKMVREFNPNALGVLTLSHRLDGSYHIIDGAHRVATVVATDHEDWSLPAEVWEGLTLAEEAAMFRHRNNTRQVSPIDKFRVRVVEGDTAAVELDEILIKYGWKVAWGTADASFAAVSAFESVYRSKFRGPGTTRDVCETVIRVITETWGHDSAGVRAELISGIGNLLLRYPTLVDLVKLTKALAVYPSGPRGLVGKAKGLRDYRGGKLSDAVSEIVTEQVNKGRRINRLPEWRSTS